MTSVEDVVDLSFLLECDHDEFIAVMSTLHPVERRAVLAEIERLSPDVEREWKPLPYQIPPPIEDNWYGFLMMGGRGIGKTATVTHLMDAHANGPPCLHGPVPHRMGIIAPTVGDASASIVHGEDGLMIINPHLRVRTRDGVREVVWPNGSFAYLFGAHTLSDVDRLRAKGNRCFDLREEIAAWRYLKDGMDQADLGLRLGLARWIGATTPRPRPTIKKLNDDPIIRVSKAKTSENIHLSEEKRTQLYEMFGGTRTELQELEGEIVEEVAGALWTQELIEAHRVTPGEVPKLVRVRTYVDPSWGTTNDEVGILVMGLGVNRHVYVFDDLSRRATPGEWGLIAALGFLPTKEQLARGVDPREYHGRVPERIVGEKNFQGEQVRLVMKLTAKELGRRILFSLVNASRGKRIRAEEALWAYEKGRVHHVNAGGRTFAGLELQMTTWVPPEVGEDAGDPGDPIETVDETGEPSKWSPDRLDALVFGVHDLGFGPSGMRWSNRGERPSSTVGELEVATPETIEVPTSSVRPPRVSRVPQRRA